VNPLENWGMKVATKKKQIQSKQMQGTEKLTFQLGKTGIIFKFTFKF
jgi:hypothetical protein